MINFILPDLKSTLSRASTVAKTLLLCCLVLLTSCSNPESDFKKAERVNTEQGYQDFIKRHPDSPLVAQAQADLEKVVYEAAKRAATSAAFESFLSRFPKSPLSKQAQVDLEAAEYDQAKRSGTAAAYEAFLRRFADGEHASKAKTELEDIEFATADKQVAITGWQSFLQKYPQSAHSATAASNLCELSFKGAAEQNTVEALESFMKAFPESSHRHGALEKLAPLVLKELSKAGTVAEYEAFLARFGDTSAAGQATNEWARTEYPGVVAANTIEAYETFLKRFPNSELSEDARKRIEPQREERDWSSTLLKNSPQDYIAFWKAHPTTTRLKAVTGTLHTSMIMRSSGLGFVASFEGQGDFINLKSQPDVQGIALTFKEHPDFKAKISVNGASKSRIINYEDLGGAEKIGTKPPIADATVLMLNADTAIAVDLVH